MRYILILVIILVDLYAFADVKGSTGICIRDMETYRVLYNCNKQIIENVPTYYCYNDIDKKLLKMINYSGYEEVKCTSPCIDCGDDNIVPKGGTEANEEK